MQSSRFIQLCPWCEKNLHIPVEYLSKQVSCRFCNGRFIASDRETTQDATSDSGLALLRRADEMLEIAQLRARHNQSKPPQE